MLPEHSKCTRLISLYYILGLLHLPIPSYTVPLACLGHVCTDLRSFSLACSCPECIMFPCQVAFVTRLISVHCILGLLPLPTFSQDGSDCMHSSSFHWSKKLQSFLFMPRERDFQIMLPEHSKCTRLISLYCILGLLHLPIPSQTVQMACLGQVFTDLNKLQSCLFLPRVHALVKFALFQDNASLISLFCKLGLLDLAASDMNVTKNPRAGFPDNASKAL